MLTRELAESIVSETMKILGRNINIMDENGIILSSGEPDRVNDFHEAAGKVATVEKPIVISEKDSGKWRGTQPGINLPIKFQEKVIGVVGISGIPEEVEDLAALVVMMTELMIQQKYLLNQVEWQQHTRAFLLEEVLSEDPSYESIEQKCSLLNVELRKPFELYVFELKGPRRHVAPREIYQEIEGLAPDHHFIYDLVNTQTLAVLHTGVGKKIFDSVLKKRLDRYYRKVRVGIARKVNDLNEIHEAFLEVRAALRLSEFEVVRPEEFEARIFLQQVHENDRKAFGDRILKDLPQELKRTLAVFFDHDLNLSKASKALFIHRNTLVYRLDKIQEWTGSDPRNFQDALTLQLAVWSQTDR
ncbi:MAG TPA: sugar diacid recognition domain-containing protein [Bacillales bacterium]|nr:sugar diacid recognition domain-containing protein [Bacillales bacterium]